MTGWSRLQSRLAWLNRHSEMILLVLIMTAGMTILGLVTFPNYFCGRFYNIDVEYFKRLVNNYSQLKIYAPTLAAPNTRFSLSVVLPAVPFYLVGGLLGIFVYQWLFVGVGAVGVYLYAREVLPRARLWPVIHFFGMWGLYSALAGNIYLEILGPMAVPYIFYFFHRRNWLPYWLSLLYLILAKENFGLWAAFVCIGLWMLYRKRLTKKEKTILVVSMILSLTASIVQLLLSIYLFSDHFFGIKVTHTYRHLLADNPLRPTRYADKGWDIVRQILCNWKYYFIMLFEPTSDVYAHQPQQLIGVKSEGHISILVSGGWSFFINWAFMVMAIPVYLYKFLTTESQAWGTLVHYSVEYAVLLPLSVIWVMKQVAENKMWIIGLVSAFLAHFMNYSLTEERLSIWYFPEFTKWYSCIHYCRLEKYRSLKLAATYMPKDKPFYVEIRHMPYLDLPNLKLYKGI